MIAMFLVEGFEEVEALTPLDYLRRAGEEVLTFGIGGKRITGSHGITVEADRTEDQLNLSELSMVILPGGLGTHRLAESDTVSAALSYLAEHDLPLAAICAAPSVPGERGMLRGHRATCFPGYEKTLIGAEVVDEPAVRDGNIVTARGAGAAQQFALAIVALLQGQEAADKLAVQVRWRT